MYKVYFNSTFFEWLDDFVTSMKKYYFDFYSNTGIYDVEKIINLYFDKYELMKTEVFNKISDICIDWIIGRKVLYESSWIESCSFVFKYWNYNIYFSAIKNQTKKEIVVSSINILN